VSSAKSRLAEILGAGDPPRRVAATLGVSTFCSLGPFFGLGLAVLIPALLALRLNRASGVGFSILIANPATTPFVLPAQLWLGLTLLHRPVPADWKSLARPEILKGLTKAYLVGGGVSALVGALMVLGAVLAFHRREP
jgi:uncharacterized protein (DUF2062 family)